MKEFHTQGNKCYFVSLLWRHLDGMAFHSLKNQTFGEGKTERCRHRGRQRVGDKNGSKRLLDMGEVQIKNERRGSESIGRIGEGVRE